MLATDISSELSCSLAGPMGFVLSLDLGLSVLLVFSDETGLFEVVWL